MPQHLGWSWGHGASAFVALTLYATLVGCGVPAPVVFGGETMGTTWSVKVAELPEAVEQADLQRDLEALLAVVDREMSTYRADSEVSLFNTSTSTEWFAVSPATAELVAGALALNQRSEGVFDITVGPLVDLWGFGPDHRPNKVPTAEEIAAVRTHVGAARLAVRLGPPALRKDHPETRIDFNAVAPGDAVDRFAALLEARGVESWLAEIGGELRARGHKRDGAPWAVAIERPSEGERGIAKVVPLVDMALATSGDYRHYFEEGGRRYSHTIDPRTGAPIDHKLASVSVLTPLCRDADAWATALSVLGPDEGYTVAVRESLAALFLVRDGETYREVATPAFERYLEANP